MSSKRFFFDLHIHTQRYSRCSDIPPEMVIAAARKRGLDGIALTEHSFVWSKKDIDELKIRAGCESFPVLAGCEISTRSEDRQTGDLLVFGATELPEKPSTIDDVCRLVHQQGGIVIAAHPYAEIVGIGDDIHSAMIDAIEVGNHRYFKPEDTRRLDDICREMDIPAIAASDAHAVDEIGAFCLELDEKILTEQDLVDAIREGRCRPRCKAPPGRFERFIRNCL